MELVEWNVRTFEIISNNAMLDKMTIHIPNTYYVTVVGKKLTLTIYTINGNQTRCLIPC